MLLKTWKAIRLQYVDDMKSIGKSHTAKILFVLLTLVPSLYAWFNIAGSWDPYANTSQLKIAIVNQDKGANIKGTQLNIGNSASEELKENKDLGWQFVDKAKADEGVRTGEYYASIEFPADLSEKISQINSGNPEQGHIIYNYNDKINAIAPKITSHGATTLQEQIESKIRATFNLVLFQDIVQGGEKLKNNRDNIVAGINNVLALNNKFPEISQQFNQIMTDAELFQKVLPTMKQTLNDSLQKIDSLQSKIPDIKNTLNQVNASVNLIQSDVSTIALNIDNKAQSAITSLNALNGLVTTNKQAAINSVTQIIADVTTMKTGLDQAISLIKVLNQLSGGNTFSDLLTRMTSLSNDIAGFQTVLNQIQTDISEGKPSSAVAGLVSRIDADRQQAKSLFTNFTTLFKTLKILAANGMSDAFNIISETLTKYKSIIETLNTFIISKEAGINKAIEQGKEIQKKLPEWQIQLKQGAAVLQPYANGQKLDEIVAMLAVNPNSIAQFLNQPITLDEVRWYPVQNYGAGMTPFYVTLSLWVGALVLVSIMKVHDKQKEKHGIIFFLGRYLVFLTVIIPQALIVSSGLILLFGLEPTSPVAFVLSTLLIGVSFSTVVYTLTYLLGDVGKGLGIVLLVLQLVSAGGTFPIEMMPKFFQNVHFFMPFTYGVSILHETIGGIVESVFIKDAIVLAVIPIAMILLFGLTHRRLEKSVHKLEEELEKAHIF